MRSDKSLGDKKSVIVEQEVVRTDGLTIDEALEQFAQDNQQLIKNLILMDCNNFNTSKVEYILNEGKNLAMMED